MTEKITTELDGPEPEAVKVGDPTQFITFRLGEQHYCINILAVREIRIIQSITRVPGVADHIRGVINLRGTIIPVCDLRKKLVGAPSDILPKHPTIIVSLNQRLTGILVDEVLDIVTVAPDEIAPLPNSEKSRDGQYFDSVITRDDTMLIVMAIDRIFRSEWEAEAELSAIN